MSIRTIVFDAYGTLFDVSGAARKAAAETGGARLAEVWPRLAGEWRRKQLEYTWLRAVMGAYEDFDTVTANALDWVLDSLDLTDPVLRARLLALYDELPPFPEVHSTLTHLRGAGYRLAILSNGSPRMLQAATRAAGLDALIDPLLSVASVRVYKPDFRVYGMVETEIGAKPQDTLFVSSNGWDIAGAARFGFNTVWVNRTGLPLDRLPQSPMFEIADLSGLPTCL